jgi:hypothetical protein
VQQDPGVVGQEAPLRHAVNLLHCFLKNIACYRLQT